MWVLTIPNNIALQTATSSKFKMRTAEPFGWKTEKEGWYHIIPCTWKIPSFLHKVQLQLYWNTVLLASKIDSHSCMFWSSRRYMTLYLYLKRVLIFKSRIETVGSLTYSQQTNSTNRLHCDSLPRSKEHKARSVHALQSNQVKRTPQDSINEFIIWKMNLLVVPVTGVKFKAVFLHA